MKAVRPFETSGINIPAMSHPRIPESSATLPENLEYRTFRGYSNSFFRELPDWIKFIQQDVYVNVGRREILLCVFTLVCPRTRIYIRRIFSSTSSCTKLRYPVFLVILLVTGNIGGGGMETTGKIRQIEITANSLFYWSRTTQCLQEHTHIPLAVLIFPK